MTPPTSSSISQASSKTPFSPMGIATKIKSGLEKLKAKDLVESVTGLSFHAKQRREQLDDLSDRCSRLAKTLQSDQPEWGEGVLKQAGEAAQRTLKKISDGCEAWQERGDGRYIASDQLIEEDVKRWLSDIQVALMEYSIHKSSSRTVQVIMYDPEAFNRFKALSLAKDPQVQPQATLVLDIGYQELLSSDTELSPEQREELVRALRSILTTDTVPNSVQLDGSVTIDPRTHQAKNTSDIYQGQWSTTIQGQPRTKIVAVKRLRATNPTQERVRKFLYEGALWRMLSHDNVVPFFGIHVHEGETIGLVSLWADNGDVISYIKSHPNANRRHFVKGAVRGIAYLHRLSVVHGSICGGNILIDASGKAMVTEFGLAAASSDDGEVISQGMSTSNTLTMARWMAPEVATSKTPTPILESDVFSFGRTILEIMTGNKPFPNEKNTYKLIGYLTDVLGNLVPPRPEEPATQNGLTDGVWELLKAMWKREPGERPRIEEVEAKLERLM